MRLKPAALIAGVALLAAACAAAPETAPSAAPAPTAAATLTQPPPTATAAPSATPQLSPTAEPQVCAPLAGWTRDQLTASISNPYAPPPFGSDDPHYGVDYAQLDSTHTYAISGETVQAVLPGTVAAVNDDRFPYGNALWVEVAPPDLPADQAGWMPTPGPLFTGATALTCPDTLPPAEWNAPDRALYVLYAHLLEKPNFQPGDAIACGQTIGAIGQSGNALAPHLHLELRSGPPGWRPGSVAHYDNSANAEEMGQYCRWRISGWFQPINPEVLIQHLP